jgi:hypothetical protein
MFRANVLASLIFGLTIAAAHAEESQEMTCTGALIEPSARFHNRLKQ